MEQTGLGEHVAMAVRKATTQTLDEFQETQRTQLQDILGELGTMIRNELDKLTPAQKAITYGILHDKLANQPKTLTQNLHLHIKGDGATALRSILGPAAESVFPAPARQDSKAPNYLDVTASPVAPGGLGTDTMREDSKSVARKK